MFKDIKWINITIISLLTTVLLFGGWLLYQSYSIEKPLNESLTEINGVKVEEMKINQKEIQLLLTLENIDNFYSTYKDIENAVEPYQGSRNLSVSFTNEGNEFLNDAWSKSYFYIAEAIAQNQYSLIPQAMDSLKVNYKLDQVGYSMDEDNIYIDLHQGDSSLYLVIERTPNMEVRDDA